MSQRSFDLDDKAHLYYCIYFYFLTVFPHSILATVRKFKDPFFLHIHWDLSSNILLHLKVMLVVCQRILSRVYGTTISKSYSLFSLLKGMDVTFST